MSAKLQESGEMYLETVLVLSKDRAIVRSVDVAERLGFSKPSVSRAMRNLTDGGYLVIKEGGGIILTESGTAIAEKTYERHRLLTELFVGLGVSREIAAADACKIEHDLSDETFDAIKKHMES